VIRRAYRVGALSGGSYREVLNTDSAFYGGSNVGNLGSLVTEPLASHGYEQSLLLTLPPLAAVVLSQ
jgi:1,4-alpha-glucan branching enzyme